MAKRYSRTKFRRKFYNRVKKRFLSKRRNFVRASRLYTVPTKKRQNLNITVSQQCYVLLNPDGTIVTPVPNTIKEKWKDNLSLTVPSFDLNMRTRVNEARPLSIDDQLYLYNPGLQKIIPLIKYVNHVNYSQLLQSDETFNTYRKLFKTYRVRNIHTSVTPMFSLTPKDFYGLTLQNHEESVFVANAQSEFAQEHKWKDIIYKYDDIMEAKYKKHSLSDNRLIYVCNPFHKTSSGRVQLRKSLRLCSFSDLVIAVVICQFRLSFGQTQNLATGVNAVAGLDANAMLEE